MVAGGFESLALPGREATDVEAEMRDEVRGSEMLATDLDHALTGQGPPGERTLADAHSWDRAAKAHAEVYEAVLG